MTSSDYIARCGVAKAELQNLLNDQNGRQRARGNLHYLLRHAIAEIEGVQKYVSTFGVEEDWVYEDGVRVTRRD